MAVEPFSVKTNLALETERIAVSEQKTIVSGISVRSGGVSLPPFQSLNMGLHVHDDPKAVVENRRRLSEQLAFPLEKWVCAQQVHGTDIVEATSGDAGAGATNLQTVLKGADGLFTTETGLLLALCFADCVPVYFYSANRPAVGLLHAGWRGTVRGGAPKMVELWRSHLRLSPEEIYAVIGPSVGPSEYEVDEKVIDEVRRLEGIDWEAAARPSQSGGGHYMLDLKELNRLLLLRSGLPADHILCSRYCTVSRPDLFFSHRRDQGRTGRMIGFIGMMKETQGDS